MSDVIAGTSPTTHQQAKKNESKQTRMTQQALQAH
jgi:hypothetical protein